MGVKVECVISQFLIPLFLKERKLPYLILVHGWGKFTTECVCERNGGEKFVAIKFSKNPNDAGLRAVSFYSGSMIHSLLCVTIF